jgi:hypothetical protein
MPGIEAACAEPVAPLASHEPHEPKFVKITGIIGLKRKGDNMEVAAPGPTTAAVRRALEDLPTGEARRLALGFLLEKLPAESPVAVCRGINVTDFRKCGVLLAPGFVESACSARGESLDKAVEIIGHGTDLSDQQLDAPTTLTRRQTLRDTVKTVNYTLKCLAEDF